jgi:hypothetical protein
MDSAHAATCIDVVTRSLDRAVAKLDINWWVGWVDCASKAMGKV